MKMIKALVCALSLLSMTAPVSAGPIFAGLAGIAVATPLIKQAVKAGKEVVWVAKVGKFALSDDAPHVIKSAFLNDALADAVQESTKLVVTAALAAGAIGAAVLY